MLTLVMAFSYVGLISGVVGNDIFGMKQTASAATTALTALPASGNLSGRYKVTSSTSRGAGSLTVTGTTVIYIASGVTLTVTGGDGSGTTAGSAGITVPSGKTLIITGPGTLKATGGKGADGSKGGNGTNAGEFGSGKGGAGGNGGGGGGAAIGSAGGAGGSGASQTSSSDTDGNKGGDAGSAGNYGTIYVLTSVTEDFTQGNGGSGGARGSKGGCHSGLTMGWHSGGGGGGGGGGAGGAAIGSGGGGGAGGGGGCGGDQGKKANHTDNDGQGGTGGARGTGGGKNGTAGTQGEEGGNHCTRGASGAAGGGGSGTFNDKNYNETTAPDFVKGTVTFHKEGGEGGTDSVKCTIGYQMTTITPPSRAGYTFQGYYTSTGGGGTQYYNDDGTSAHVYDYYELDLYAYWTPNEYTATFKADDIPDPTGALNDSPNDSAPTYNTDGTFTFPSGLTKNYYTFDNIWKVTNTSGETSWTVNDTFAAGSTTTAGKYGDVTFRAQYTPIDYQIEFDPNGSGAGDVPSNWSTPYANRYKYNYENRAKSDYTLQTALPATTWLGYTLVGWQPTAAVGNWDPAHVYPAGTSLAGMHGDSAMDTVVLKAVWDAVPGTVTLDLSAGGSISGSTTLAYSFNTSLALNNPSRTGYNFKGWKVTAVPNYGSDYNTYPAANRWVMDTEYLLGQETQVTLDSGKLGDVTLKPIWEHIKYTITYNGNGGSTPAAKDYYIDSAAFTLAATTRNGYDFDGWTVDAHDDVYNWTASSYDAGASVSGRYGNVTLKANWLPHEYTVTLDVNGGDAITPATLTYKTTESTALPETPTRTGYTFTGWKVVTPIAGSWVEGTVYAVPSPALPVGNYGNLKLQAQWTPTEYTITKTTNGGTNGDSVTYHINDAAFTLGASSLPGYTFVNWTVDADAGNWHQNDAYGADTSISGKWGDVNLTAHFTPITYTITYKDKDGETQYVDTYTIEDAVEIDDYAVPGYTFGGWIVSGFDETTGGGWHNGDDLSAGTLSANMYYGDITLTPNLTAKSYTITYDFNGAPATCGNLPYTIESTDELPGNTSANPPTKTGHDFSGWKVVEVGDEGNWTVNAVVPGNTVLTGKYGSVKLQAQWTPKNYTITYITGMYPDGITRQGTYGQPAPDLTDAEKAKPADAQYTYTFDHWEPSLTTVTGEKTYTAVYENTLNKYNITWMIPDDLNGTLGNYTATVTPDVEYGATPVYNNGVNPELASDSPSEYEWRFAGWSLTAGGAKLESIPAVTGVATYYALFTKVLAPEQVIWDIEGVTNTELWGIGEIPEWRHDTPTKADANGYKYTFTHWDPTLIVVEQHGGPYTYYAQFSSSLQDYTITLKLNGGSMSDPLTIGYQMGDSVTFPAPEKTGYRFTGWLLDEAAGSWAADTTVSAGSYATGTKWGNVSFTAQWAPVEYTITFAAATENDVLPADKTYTIESTDALPAASCEGHTLTGWLISVGDGNWTQGATLAAAYTLLENYGNVTLTPIWQVNTYTLTWISGDYTETSEAEYGSAILVYAPLSKVGYSAKWDQEVPAAMPAQNLTFRAVYTPVDYYIRFNANGGSAVDNFYYTIEGCSENETPTFDTLPTPTRDGATFMGWKVTAAQGNWVRNAVVDGGTSLTGKYGNVSLTAQWQLRTHTVTWVAGDVTRETVWYYGATPSYDGTPYKSPDESNSYVFSGWDKEIVPVTEDVTYTALFDATEREYTVVWNVDGATRTQYYHYGETPVYPGENDPVRDETSEYVFTFTGWSPAVTNVAGDVTYTAQFDVFTKLQGLSIDVSSLFLNIGANDTVQAQIYPATATVRDVVWTSRNTEVATIDSTGTVTAVSPGIALINVSSVDARFNAYCVVTVAPVHTSYLAISAGGVSTTQLPGAMLQLSATLQPDNATDPGITWSSGDISVATVDNTGLVRFVNVGETDIVALASDGFSLGSIHVVTTTNEEEVEDNVTTYRVTFGDFATGFRFKEDGEVYKTGYCSVPEGETLRFKLNVEDGKQANYSVMVNGSRISYGDDYWYALEDVHDNMVVTLRDGGAGTGVPQIDIGGNDEGMGFFQRLAAFFRKIVEFFRGLFNR